MKKYAIKEIKLKPILHIEDKINGLPNYVFEDGDIKVNWFYYLYNKLLLNIFKIILRIRLKILGSSYKKYKNDPLHKDVENIYTREAEKYEYKHHLTTNFRDIWWRRQIGLEIINYVYANKKNQEQIKILDIGTGIGLSLEEMFRMFKFFDIKINAIGLDYNQKMLEWAKQVILPRILKDGLLEKGIREIKFTRGDARNLTSNDQSNNNLEYFKKDSFDCITLLFCIGGIDEPLKSIKEQLMILKPGGILTITDIHHPIIKLKEKWPWFIGNKNGYAFAVMAWREVTKPLVLSTLWGWRDPTPVFYLVPLITYHDKKKNIYYGFEQISLFLDNEFWWFKMPVMPTAKVVFKKVEISKEEVDKSTTVLNQVSFYKK